MKLKSKILPVVDHKWQCNNRYGVGVAYCGATRTPGMYLWEDARTFVLMQTTYCAVCNDANALELLAELDI